jgi:two-component system chemotaxis response regulator CheB
MKSKIKILIVDDSAVVRRALTEILSAEEDFEVIGAAADPYTAVAKMKAEGPDVITLDVEMPGMDGVTFLRKIMSQHPIPVVICSSLAGEGSATAIEALACGAVDVVYKPRLGADRFLEESRMRLTDAVRAAKSAKIKLLRAAAKSPKTGPKLTADAVLPPPPERSMAMTRTTEKIVVIGASTGGVQAISELLPKMPPDCPGIVIVQHMPEKFTASFAKRLDGDCRITVKEAQNNDSVIPGSALIAPGNLHTLLKRSGARYFVEVRDGPPVSRHRPSVDVLFRSAARYAGPNAAAALLTGMGDDGAKGMLEMRRAGALTIAQDEESCIVFGMPNEAVKLGGAAEILSLDKIAARIAGFKQTGA